ncbi:hypothetical protein [Ferrovibrio sp.]|uniref:hypothetical protein n=1 Tax=Ferrovibrio sp. TaxID=1917215 RepID=UPI002622DCCD|nr:hypothetical protein [Ferrovibrio sp.]
MVILFGTNMASAAFPDSDVGYWTGIAFLVVCGLNMPTMLLQGGLTRLLSFPHFIWVPLVLYLYSRLFGVDALPAGPARPYAVAVLLVNSISLLFDLLEAYRWIRGDRRVLGIAD